MNEVNRIQMFSSNLDLVVMRKLLPWVALLAVVNSLPQVVPPLSHFNTVHINPAPFLSWPSRWRAPIPNSRQADSEAATDVH